MRERASASLAAILAARGDRQGAERRLRELVTRASSDHHVSYRIGTAYAQLRRPDDAVRWLRRAAETGFPCYEWFSRDPLLAPVRAHPLFVQLLDGLRPMAVLRRNQYLNLVERF